MNERDYLIALSSYIYFGPERIKLLHDFFGSYEKTFNASNKELTDTGLKISNVENFIKHRTYFDYKNFLKRINLCGAKVVTILDPDYPSNLIKIADAPSVLYVRGDLKREDANSVAIVGSRMMTDYGHEIARKFSVELSKNGFSIVSGLAFGVDVEVHKAALEAGGRCIAVLASGIDTITPRTNSWLGIKIIEKGGAVISEYPPGIIPQKYFFPYRNRIISGLTRGVLVIEGLIKSGTLHTARHAGEQGRSVFAVPGDITSPLSAAPLHLIKNGAIPVTDVRDIIEELDTP